jgi:hypothetical protein
MIGVLFLVALVCFAPFFWGQGGGVVGQQVDMKKGVESHLRLALPQDIHGFRAEHVVADWPKRPGMMPGQALAYDRTNGTLVAVFADGQDMTRIKIEPKDLISVELLEDEHTVGQVSRARQAGGALAGAALAGATGAVIGGLSSGQGARSEVTRIGLLAVTDMAMVDDTPSPPIDFCFWDQRASNGWANLGPDDVRQVRAEARKWFSFFEEHMKRVTSAPAAGGPAEFDEVVCPGCETAVSTDSRFCAYCGAGLETA